MIQESREKWVHTKCAACYAGCAMKVKAVDGVMVKAEGVAEHDFGARGGLCGKGTATIMDFYDPNRVSYPVKRTNPKGLFEDPKWERISWEEAFSTIAEKLKAAKENDPRTICFTGTPMYDSAPVLGIFWPCFHISLGTPNFIPGGVGTHCGAASHEGAGLFHASWSVIPDYRYCNYVLQFGSNKGTGSGHSAAMAMRQAADARDKGLKFIVFDPICNFSGGKATEWHPILPATDGAVAMAICYLIVHEIGVYDKEFVRHKTNGPYLVGPDKTFVRDTDSGKPLLWDESDETAKTYDDAGLSRPAIEGEFSVNGVKCSPAWEIIKESLKKYDPAWASQESTVPEHVIRRVAKEFVEEAKIGATIEIEGHTLPYRPATAIMYKGGQGHQNGANQYFPIMLMNTLIGACEAVGGTSSWPARSLGYPETDRPKFEPYAGDDGYITPGMWYTGLPWPKPKPTNPQFLNLRDMFPHAPMTIFPFTEDFQDIWDKAGRPHEAEVIGNFGGNCVKNASNPDNAAKFLSEVPFFWSVNIFHNETTEGFADIVLPDCHFLESTNALQSITYFFNHSTAMDDWTYPVRQAVVEPQHERKEVVDILFELANRLGIRKEFNDMLDNYVTMKMAKWECIESDCAIVKEDEDISLHEFSDRTLKYLFGPEKGLEWFKKNQFITWKKKVEEAYWRWFIDARAPIYLEFLEHDRDLLRNLGQKVGIEMEWERYAGPIGYARSILYSDDIPAEFDMIVFSFKDIGVTGSVSPQNPWLNEVLSTNPYTYNLMMNTETAKNKGISDGDFIVLENPESDTVTGRVKLMKGIHQQTVGCCGHLGSWAKGKPVARGKGVNMNTLLRLTHKHLCPITLAPETCWRVKIYKAKGDDR
jgi:molybdopterin-containing oxidoreductase family molybdopterin binding subunit